MRSLAPLLGPLLALVAAACGSGPAPAPDAAWPEGALLSGRREALVRLLTPLTAMEATPLARASRDWLAALPDCPELEARAESAASLPGALRCAGSEDGVGGLHGYRGEASLALALPAGGDAAKPRVLLRMRASGEAGAAAPPAATEWEIRWPRAAVSDALAAWLPGPDPAGAPILSGAGAVLHARARSEGLDLAALAAPGSQADQLFKLRSDLLSAALLDGRWELAIHLPGEGEPMPRVAAALGVRSESAARAAADRFLDEVEATWPVQRRAATLQGREGACLPDLQLLPGLAPCWVVTDGALVLGWNGESVARALAGDAAGGVEPPAPGRIEIDFARLAEADRLLARRHEQGERPATRAWPWRRWIGRAEGRDDAVWLHLEMQPAPPTLASRAP